MESFATTFQMMTSAKVSRMHAIEGAGRIAQSVASALYSQVDPVTIGAMQRSIAVAMEYGTRLAKRSKSISPDKLRKLIAGYPAHSFCIDRDEAQDLFGSVHRLEDAKDLTAVLAKYFDKISNPIQDKCFVCKVDQDETNGATPSEGQESATLQNAGVAKRGRKSGEKELKQPSKPEAGI